MNVSDSPRNTSLLPLAISWLALISLTLFSLVLGEWMDRSAWLPALVASVIWIKAWVIARHFLEVQDCTRFIRRLVLGFIAFAPIALVLTDTFGVQLAGLLRL